MSYVGPDQSANQHIVSWISELTVKQLRTYLNNFQLKGIQFNLMGKTEICPIHTFRLVLQGQGSAQRFSKTRSSHLSRANMID